MSMTDAVCLMADQDYLIIEDSSNVCMQGGIVGVTKDLYCGMFLNTFDGSVVDTTICGKRSFNFKNSDFCMISTFQDCTAPFEVDVRTDPGTGMQGRGALSNLFSLSANLNLTWLIWLYFAGTCLEYTQIPCA